MEGIREEGEPEFEMEKSPLKEAYLLLRAYSPLELSNLYAAEDQKIAKSGEWDYGNPDLITNKVKDMIEKVDLSELTEDERQWAQEILWFWYHHATSCALFIHKDKGRAKVYAEQALRYQSDSHPNKITKLLYLLADDRLEEAEEWAANEVQDESEKRTAASLVEEYKELGIS